MDGFYNLSFKNKGSLNQKKTMFVIAKWCRTHRNIIYGNQKDELKEHIHIWETLSFGDTEKSCQGFKK